MFSAVFLVSSEQPQSAVTAMLKGCFFTVVVVEACKDGGVGKAPWSKVLFSLCN